MSEAGEAVVTGGEPPKPSTFDPNNLPPEALAAVNARIAADKAALLAAERKRWESEQEAAKKQAEMSELEKAQSRLAEYEAKIKSAEAESTRSQRTIELVAASGNKITASIARAIVSQYGDDWDVAKALEAANAEADALVALRGGMAATTAARPATRTGGTPSGTAHDLAEMTPDQVVAHAERLSAEGKPKEAREFIRNYRRIKAGAV